MLQIFMFVVKGSHAPLRGCYHMLVHQTTEKHSWTSVEKNMEVKLQTVLLVLVLQLLTVLRYTYISHAHFSLRFKVATITMKTIYDACICVYVHIRWCACECACVSACVCWSACCL